jgi:hypothetical protein
VAGFLTTKAPRHQAELKIKLGVLVPWWLEKSFFSRSHKVIVALTGQEMQMAKKLVSRRVAPLARNTGHAGRLFEKADCISHLAARCGTGHGAVSMTRDGVSLTMTDLSLTKEMISLVRGTISLVREMIFLV